MEREYHEVRRRETLNLSEEDCTGILSLAKDLPAMWHAETTTHAERKRLYLGGRAARASVFCRDQRGEGAGLPRLAVYVAYAPRAKQLLPEAGYPNGFDAGDFYPWPPYTSMGEALASDLQAVGIRTRIRTMERAAMQTAWREHRLKGVIVGITGAAGNAATRLEAFVSRNGIFSAGVIPEVEDLFQRQARELDVKKREALLHQIQQVLHDQVRHVPIYELAFIWGVGPRVEEPGIHLIKGFAYSGPLEDVKLKRP